MRTSLLAAGAVTLAFALGGCGGDDSSKGTTTATADAPPLDTVLDCLKVDGLDAKDQSSSTGDKIGIDYPGGRLVISFEESAEDADSYASAAKATGETAIVKGTVAITIPDDPAAKTDQPKVEQWVAPS